MALHYQVYAVFNTLTNGKRSLTGLSIYSTHAACTSLPFWPNPATYLTISRIFPTLRHAHSYIAYLQGVYQQNPATPPVLCGGQLDLFSEVSK
jgi:hypothetical protein